MNKLAAAGIARSRRAGKRTANPSDEAGVMRAILRVDRLLLAGWTVILASPAFAQQTVPPTTTNPPAPASNAPATDAIGPRELQNFSLPGTATRPAQQAPSPATSTPSPSAQTQPTESGPAPTHRINADHQAAVRHAPVRAPAAALPATAQAPATATTSPALPEAPPTPVPQRSTVAPALPPSAAEVSLAPNSGFSILPWLIAAILLAAGTGLLLWRRRPREALAGAGEVDLLSRPEPEPTAAPGVRWMPPPEAERPEPVPTQAPASPRVAPLRPAAEAPRGIVASRLRPALEIGVRPLRCLVEDSQVTLEFELDLFNAGTAPARAILAEASLLNASATQDQELGAFFSRPAAAGEPLDAIAPMTRMTMTSRVVAPRAAIQEYDLGGRKAFVPVIAFNAMYEWSSGKAQTSAAYLVGRETDGEKLGPLRLDSSRREVRGLGARTLPLGVRS